MTSTAIFPKECSDMGGSKIPMHCEIDSIFINYMYPRKGHGE